MILIFVAISWWIACGVLAYGSFIAHAIAVGYEMDGTEKQQRGTIMVICGPFALVLQAFSTDFFSHGIKFRIAKGRGIK